MTRGMSESIFARLSLVGAAVPPRDPNDDEDEEDEENGVGCSSPTSPVRSIPPISTERT